MNEFDPKSGTPAERLIGEVFDKLAGEADCELARTRLGYKLERMARPRQRRHHMSLRLGFKLAMYITALALLGSWAVSLPVAGWDDGQQITIELPETFVAASYPHVVAIFANHSQDLASRGGHSLVVDYFQGTDDRFYIRLNILGISCSDANEWIRGVMKKVPQLRKSPYTVTQPLVPYQKSVRDMLAYSVAPLETVEKSVVEAWRAAGDEPGKHGFVYIIARPERYARRVSMVEY
jgi:hypothetical protein